MREIKFRVWDKKIKEMGRVYTFMVILNILQGVETGFYPGGELKLGNNFILMQFTGLKDKNGKDIYEGDIVENYAFKDVVIFSKGIFTTQRSTKDKFSIKQPLSVHDELEVIGNIYENPELLK